MAALTVIWWRDIPAQVVAKDARRASKIVLHPRFQVAIDRAAVKAGRREMDAYIAEWRKTQRPCGDDLEARWPAEVDPPRARVHPRGPGPPRRRRRRDDAERDAGMTRTVIGSATRRS